MYLFFDTETTGLPTRWGASPLQVDVWPRVVQLGYALFDNNGKKKSSASRIIKPDGYVISPEVTRIHGISHETALLEGFPIIKELKSFLKQAQKADLLVAHNVDFDYPIITAELIRSGIPTQTWSEAAKFCTMKQSAGYLKIPGRRGYKWPKLKELHHALFGDEPAQSHDAEKDALTTARCFFELKKRGYFQN